MKSQESMNIALSPCYCILWNKWWMATAFSGNGEWLLHSLEMVNGYCIFKIQQRQSTDGTASFFKFNNDGRQDGTASVHPFSKQFNDGRQDGTASVHQFFLNSSTTVDRMTLHLCIHFLKQFNDSQQDGTVSVHPFLKTVQRQSTGWHCICASIF